MPEDEEIDQDSQSQDQSQQDADAAFETKRTVAVLPQKARSGISLGSQVGVVEFGIALFHHASGRFEVCEIKDSGNFATLESCLLMMAPNTTVVLAKTEILAKVRAYLSYSYL